MQRDFVTKLYDGGAEKTYQSGMPRPLSSKPLAVLSLLICIDGDSMNSKLSNEIPCEECGGPYA